MKILDPVFPIEFSDSDKENLTRVSDIIGDLLDAFEELAKRAPVIVGNSDEGTEYVLDYWELLAIYNKLDVIMGAEEILTSNS